MEQCHRFSGDFFRAARAFCGAGVEKERADPPRGLTVAMNSSFGSPKDACRGHRKGLQKLHIASHLKRKRLKIDISWWWGAAFHNMMAFSQLGHEMQRNWDYSKVLQLIPFCHWLIYFLLPSKMLCIGPVTGGLYKSSCNPQSLLPNLFTIIPLIANANKLILITISHRYNVL